MQTLRCGPFHLTYLDGFLHHLRHGETEILRMIYLALRDHDWNTINYQVENEKITAGGDHFSITYTAVNTLEGKRILSWDVSIEGAADGSIAFSVDGEVLADFKKNRAGICVLHPLEGMRGRGVAVTHPDGTTSSAAFPDLVVRENPLRNIRALSWNMAGLDFRLDFQGEIFETEDQRNWSDASFKTFCTPADLPTPVTIRRGERIRQQARFSVATPPVYIALTERAELKDTGEIATIPLLGMGVSANAPDIFKGLHHARIEVTPSAPDWVSSLSRDYETTARLGIAAEIALWLGDKPTEDAEAFIQLCQQNRVRMYKVVLYSKGKGITNAAAIAVAGDLKRAFPNVLVGAGTSSDFKEINSVRLETGSLDFVSYGVTPQVHLRDDLTLIDNVQSQADAVVSAAKQYSKAVHISPVQLRRELADPRLHLPIGGAWTFGSILSFARGAAGAVTYFEMMGDNGIVNSNGVATPAFDVIKRFAPLQGKQVLLLRTATENALSFAHDGKATIMNMTSLSVVVRYKGEDWKLDPWQLRTL